MKARIARRSVGIRDLDELIEELEHLLSKVGLLGWRKLGIRLMLRIGQRRREVAKKPGDVDAEMAGDAGEQGGRRALLASLEARQERGGEAQVVGKMLELDLEEQSTQPDSSPDEAVHSRGAVCSRSAARGVLFDWIGHDAIHQQRLNRNRSRMVPPSNGDEKSYKQAPFGASRSGACAEPKGYCGGGRPASGAQGLPKSGADRDILHSIFASMCASSLKKLSGPQ